MQLGTKARIQASKKTPEHPSRLVIKQANRQGRGKAESEQVSKPGKANTEKRKETRKQVGIQGRKRKSRRTDKSKAGTQEGK